MKIYKNITKLNKDSISILSRNQIKEILTKISLILTILFIATCAIIKQVTFPQ